MPSFERGVYEPKSDDVRVIDEDEQEIDEEGSRLPLLIVIALLVLAAGALGNETESAHSCESASSHRS